MSELEITLIVLGATVSIVWLPIALGIRIGARKPAALPKAQVRK